MSKAAGQRAIVRSMARVPLIAAASCLVLRSLLAAEPPANPAADSAAAAKPQAGVSVRAGDHDGFGRIVFDFSGPVHVQQHRVGDRVVLRFDRSDMIAPVDHPPRNVTAMSGGAGQATIALVPGAQAHWKRSGSRIILDIFDATAAPKVQARTKPEASDTGAHRPTQAAGGQHEAAKTEQHPLARKAADQQPTQTDPGVAASAIAAPPQTSARPVPAEPGRPAESAAASVMPARQLASGMAASAAASPDQPSADPGASDTATASPQSVTATPVPAPTETPQVSDYAGPLALAATAPLAIGTGEAFSVPFAKTVGAAAFRRGDTAIVVFDDQRPIDLSSLHGDRVLGSATVQLLQAATVVRLKMPPQTELRLTRAPLAWTIAIVSGPPALRPIIPTQHDHALTFPVAAPGQVVTVIDPDTGSLLLVGTQRESGQAIAASRRAPEFNLLPTWQGVVVEALSDRLALRADPTGFVLTAGGPGGPGLALGADSDSAVRLAEAGALTRRFDIPNQPEATLMRRIDELMLAAASAPPLGRLRSRIEAARAMIGLGLGPEAQALVEVAANDDPRAANNPEIAGLGAVGALIADREGDADAIDSPALSGSDEVALWRAVRLAQRQEGAPVAAAFFAASAPLLLTYPVPLREKLAPLAAETMALGGQPQAARTFIDQFKDLKSLDLARAIVREKSGDVDGALAGYDALAAGEDRLAQVRAATRAIDLRFATGRMDAAAAATAYDKLLYAWRGDQRAMDLRMRAADLLQQAGMWRQALMVLRDSEAEFPDQKDRLAQRLAGAFETFLRSGAVDKMASLDLVSLVEDNADLIPTGDDGQALASHLADRLLALDLPGRAGPVLAKLMSAATPGPVQAGFGLRLAQLRMNEGDAGGALAALTASAVEGLPADLAETRTLLLARAAAKMHDPDRAVAALTALGTPPCIEARATILADTGDWRGAQTALTEYAAIKVPHAGTLDEEQQRILLRLASAAAQAGDHATLTKLRTTEGPRMDKGKFGEMFRLLTAEQVEGADDLGRSRKELSLARTMPAAIAAMPAAAVSP